MNFNAFFRGDNPFFVWCNRITDAVMLSVMWVFFSLPLVTMGPATAALYFVVVKCLRGGEGKTYSRFWRAFLEDLKVGIPATLISAAALALLSVGLEIARRMSAQGGGYTVFYVAYYCAALLPVGIICYLFPLLGRFSFSLRGLFTTALQLTVRHLPSTLVIVLLTIQVVNFCLKWPMAFFLAPSLLMLVGSLFLERIFQRYLPAPEGPQTEQTSAQPQDQP